jgi:2-oxoglutarate ferredoxin oxidoreductase subunit alpha
MCRRLTWDDAYRPDRGKVLGAEELETIKRFSRYADVDGDGIAARTLPGVHPRGGYFTRGSGHDKHATYTADSAEYQEVVDRLAVKLRTAANAVPKAGDAPRERERTRPTSASSRLADVTPSGAEAVGRLRRDGTTVDYMRIRAPFLARSSVH